MADGFAFLNKGSNGSRSAMDEEFDEEDVWTVVKDKRDGSPKFRKEKNFTYVSSSRRLPTATRMIPRGSNSNHESKALQQSAPVNIPDWSKIYSKSAKGSKEYGLWMDDADGNKIDAVVKDHGDSDEVDYDDDDDDRVPPHEWIAKKLARSQISSFSVCEGVGRTLKGRDLSKVRDAVLTRTGFLE